MIREIARPPAVAPRFRPATGRGGTGMRPVPRGADHRASIRLWHTVFGAFVAAVATVAFVPASRAADEKPELESGKVHLVLQGAAMPDASQFGGQEARFFVARVEIVNRTEEPVAFIRRNVRLTVDGKTFSDQPLPAESRYLSVPVAGRSQSLHRLDRPEQVTVAAGSTTVVWLTFRDIPRVGSAPRLKLEIDFGGKSAELDVAAESRERLMLEVTRMGPHDALGLLTISGEVDGINAGFIADALDHLAEQKVRRVVIRFSKAAKPLPGDVQNWLEEAAYALQRPESNYRQFPTITRALRELHLAQIPGDRNSARLRRRSYGMYGVVAEKPPRVHATDRQAIVEALREVYAALPQDQLIAELRNPNELLRAAAIAGGGHRLPAESLPALIEATRASDPLLRDAAVAALRHFGEDSAIARLVELAQANDDKQAQPAIEALATSRFAAAYEALGRLLRDADADSKARIVRVLAEHPRPQWAEPIFECASAGDVRLRITAVKALATMDHPRLLELLERMLAETDSRLRDQAFRILVERNDPASEKIALAYALSRMENQLPDGPTMELLNRTRDSRAVPLLIQHFRKSPSARQTVIQLLARVGDQNVEAFLVEQYPGLRSQEKSAVLAALLQLRSNRLRPLAIEALTTGDPSLAHAACQALIADSGPEAAVALADAFENSKDPSVWSQAANALANIGTPECYAALDRGRKVADRGKRQAANNALRVLRQRSPGFQYVWLGQEHLSEQNWEQAQRVYDSAIKLDPNLPDAYVGRGTARLHLGTIELARADMEKAIELDSGHGGARTGLGLVFVFEDRVTEGIEYIERYRSDFRNDAAFAYNAACVYSRAAERLGKKMDDSAAIKQAATFREKAIADLKESVRQGFRDFDHIQNDPDLTPLHDHPEFAKVLSEAAN